MFRWLLLVFIIVPLIEIYFLIQVGQVIGAPSTILLVVLTAVLGSAIARSQGLSVLSKIRSEMDQGVMPGDSLLEGFLVLAGGMLLLAPGFFTDLFGLMLLIPASRRVIGRWLRRWLYNYMSYARVYRYRRLD